MVKKNKFTARPTVYKGIQMRSRLEAGFAAWLDREHLTWEYEPCAFATEAGQYLPDFRLSNVNVVGMLGTRTVYAEVKPDSFMKAGTAEYRGERALINQQWGILHASDPRRSWSSISRPGSGSSTAAVPTVTTAISASASCPTRTGARWPSLLKIPGAARVVVEPMTPDQVAALAAPVAAYLEQRAAEIAQLDIRAAEQRAANAEEAAEEAERFGAQRVTDLQEEQARQLVARDKQVERLRDLVQRERDFTAKLTAEQDDRDARVMPALCRTCQERECVPGLPGCAPCVAERLRELEAKRDRLAEQVQAVRERHYPPPYGPATETCNYCDEQWPCTTARTLDGGEG